MTRKNQKNSAASAASVPRAKPARRSEVTIVDPKVKPTNVSIEAIRRAVAAVKKKAQ